MYIERKNKKLIKPLADFLRYIPALITSEVSFTTKIFRLFIFIGILTNAEFGMKLFTGSRGLNSLVYSLSCF